MKKIIALLYAVWFSIAIVCASSVEVRSARALYAKKDYVGAMENLKKAIKEDSKDVEALFMLSVLYYEMNDFDNAFKYIDKAIKYGKKDPNLPIYHGTKASFYLESNDTVAALKEYDFAISLDPSNKEVLLDRAIMFRKMKQYDKSTAELKKVIAMEPNHQAYRGVAQNEYLKKNYKAAADWYTTTLENFSDSYYTYILRGKSYLMMKEYDKAFDDVLSAIPTKYFEEASHLLNELVDSTSFDSVMNKLKNRVEEKPSKLISENVIPNLYYNYGKVYEAIDIYSSTLHSGEANDYIACLYIADCYLLAGEYDKALAYCDSAYAVDPKKMRCWRSKLRIYTIMEEYDKALATADVLLEDNSNSSVKRLSKKALLEKKSLLDKKSEIKQLKGDLQGAMDDLEQSCAIVEDNFDNLKKATLLYKMGRQKDGEQILKKLLEDQEFVSGRHAKYAYALLGQKDKARSLCETEIAEDSDDFFNIACTYGVLGEYSKGLPYIRKSLEKQPTYIVDILVDFDMEEYKKLPEFWNLINDFRPKKR